MRIASALLLAACLPAIPFAASAGTPSSPSLKADTAVYDLASGVLQYRFTFANPSDAVLFLDCQVPPRAFLAGGTLVLEFDRHALPVPQRVAEDSGTVGSGTGSESGAVAGGPAAGAAGAAGAGLDPADFPPQRIGAGQTFQGQRRLDRVLGDFQARPKFTGLQLRMAYYAERDSGEGEPFVSESVKHAASRVLTVAKRGKVPPPPAKIIRRRLPAAD